jgi:MerR family transcriptional regulator/heat shock protein HspR
MGVNLAGIEIILNMREKMLAMEQQMQQFVDALQEELGRGSFLQPERRPRNAIIPLRRPAPQD